MFEDLHLSIMLATMVIFLVMIVVLNTIFYKPLLRFIDERNDSIKNDENKVKENSQEMVGANEEVRKIHQNTKEEINKIKQNAIAQAKEESTQLIRAKKEELERKMASFYTELAEQREELSLYLQTHLPDFKEALQNNIRKI